MAYKVTVVFDGRNDARTYEDVGHVSLDGALVLDFAGGKTTIIPWHRIAEVTAAADVPVKAPDLPVETLSPKKGVKVAPKEEEGFSDL